MLDSRIKQLNDCVYSICGKIICFKPDVLDLSDPEVVDDLVGFASKLYTDASRVSALYGGKSICTLRSRPGSDDVMIGVYSLDVLPEESRSLARKELGFDRR